MSHTRLVGLEELGVPIVLLKNVLKRLPGVDQLYLTVIVVEDLSDGRSIHVVNYWLRFGCILHRVIHSRESL